MITTWVIGVAACAEPADVAHPRSRAEREGEPRRPCPPTRGYPRPSAPACLPYPAHHTRSPLRACQAAAGSRCGQVESGRSDTGGPNISQSFATVRDLQNPVRTATASGRSTFGPRPSSPRAPWPMSHRAHESPVRAKTVSIRWLYTSKWAASSRTPHSPTIIGMPSSPTCLHQSRNRVRRIMKPIRHRKRQRTHNRERQFHPAIIPQPAPGGAAFPQLGLGQGPRRRGCGGARVRGASSRKEDGDEGACLPRPGTAGRESVPDSRIDAPTDAVVRIDSTTICGTDLHILKGDVPQVRPGTVLGHEAVATVVETGAAVTTIRPGDRVLVSCITSCGRCRYCKEGHYGLCTGGGGWIFGHLDRRPPG